MNGVIIPSPIVRIPNTITTFNSASVNLLEPSQYADITNFRDVNQYSPLFYAIKFNSDESAKLILDYGGRLNTTDQNKNTPLHTACLLGKEKLIKIFLDYYPDMINSINIEKQNPLHTLILSNNNKIINVLLDYKNSLNLIKSQDSNDRTPLMYAIELKNTTIINQLLNVCDRKNSELMELQDVEGNTHYHLAIKYLIDLDMFDPPTTEICKKINTDGNTILHLLLINNLTNYFPDILKNSSFLIQNIENNTVLHYLIPDKWKKYISILENKKLSVFLKNKNNISPYDVLSNDKKFIDLVIKSYYNQLIENPTEEYITEWETKCSNKKLLMDKCIVEIKNNINNGISYPQKKKNYCINITSKLVSNSSYTGITIDIIGGLISLNNLTKKSSISSLSLSNIVTNYKLTEFYTHNRIIRNDFLNFEIIWSYQTIFFPNGLDELFKKFLNNKKLRYFIIPIGIELAQGSHANILIFDKKYYELERFEPDGSKPPNGFFYFPDELDTYIYQYFQKIFNNKPFEYKIPMNSIPRISFQRYEILESNNSNNRGYCGAWCAWYAYQRIRTGIQMKKLIPKLLQKIRGSNMTFKHIVRNYASIMADIRDDVFKKSKLVLDDWFNTITNDQLNILSENIKKMI